MRWLRWLKRFAAGLAIAVGGILFLPAGCVAVLRWLLTSQTEVARARSPDGAFDAVVIEIGGDATNDPNYRVEVESRGFPLLGHTEAAYLYDAVRNDSAYGVNVRWTGPHALTIEYLRAERIDGGPSISPRWTGPIGITLDSGVVDPRAPAGYMRRSLYRGH